MTLTSGTARHGRMHRTKVVGLSFAMAFGLLAAAPAASAMAQNQTEPPQGSVEKVVAADKYGKWATIGKSGAKCRIYLAVGAGTKATATGTGECTGKVSQVVVAALTIDNKDGEHTTKRGVAKRVYTDVAEMKNPKGKQSICAIGYVNHPTDETQPNRSTAKVCVKA